MTQTPSGGGGELGIATLSIEVNTQEADAQIRSFLDRVRDQLGALTVDPVAGSRQASRQVSRTSAPSPDTQVDVAEARDAVRRFNLRGFSAQLDAIAEQLDFNVDARNLNIRSSWTAFLTQLNEVSEQLVQTQAVRAFNINASWTSFLTQLNEVSEQLVQTQAGRELNIRSNWAAFLSQLDEVSEQLVLNSGAEQLNLRSSWTAFLEDLQEVSGQLQQRERAKNLNIRSSWAQFLEDLDQVAEDIAQLGKAKDLNIRSSWNVFLEQLQEVAQDLSQLRKAKDINLRSNWNRFLEDLENTAEQLTSLKSAEQLNLRTNWTQFLTELEEVDQDLKLSEGAKELNLRSSWQKFLGQLQEIKSDLDRSTLEAERTEGLRVGKLNASPIRGGAAFPGSPVFLANQDKIYNQVETALQQARLRTARETQRAVESERRLARQRISALNQGARNILANSIGSGIIGAGFPLLFGQGAGASVGGGLGGLAGGLLPGQFGFGLSIAGTAIGSQLDNLLNAFKKPVEGFSAIEDAALLSSESLTKTVRGLIDLGKNAEATAIITADLAAQFGDISQFGNLQETFDQLGSELRQLSIEVALVASGPLTEFIQKIREFFTIQRELTPQEIRRTRDEAQDLVRNNTSAAFQLLGPLVPNETVSFDGQNFTGSLPADIAIQIAEYKQRLILQERGKELTEAELALRERAKEAEKRLTEATKERVAQQTLASQRSLRDAEFDLRGAEGTRGLQGPALQIAQQLLAIDRARVVEADRIADANAALARQREVEADPTAKERDRVAAEGALAAASNAVAEAGVRFRENLINGARTAADALRDARQNFLDARTRAFDLLTPQAQQGLLQFRNSEIDKLQKTAGISQAAVDKLQATLNQNRDAAGLAELANTLRNVDTANENLVNSQQKMTEFLDKNTGALLALGQKQWLVDVLVQANGRALTSGDALPRVLQ